MATSKKSAKKRTLSPEARKRIADAQRKRWGTKSPVEQAESVQPLQPDLPAAQPPMGAEQISHDAALLSGQVADHAALIREKLLGILPAPSNPVQFPQEGPLKDNLRGIIINLEEISDALFVIREYLGIQ